MPLENLGNTRIVQAYLRDTHFEKREAAKKTYILQKKEKRTPVRYKRDNCHIYLLQENFLVSKDRLLRVVVPLNKMWRPLCI